MVLSKFKLPNDNVLIWLGTGGLWGKTEGVDNVLILAGGDVLFLETIKTIALHDEVIREDIANLSCEAIIAKYELPVGVELIQDLKDGLETGKYPPTNQNLQDWIVEFKGMILAYIAKISQLKDPEERIRQLEAIRRECEKQILETRRS